MYSRPIPAHPGRKYTLSLQLKSVGATIWPRIEVDALGANISTISPFPKYPGATSSWSQFIQTFTLPSNFTAPNMCVHIGYPSSGDLYVDDVRLMVGDSTTYLALKDKISVGPAGALAAGNLFFSGVASPVTMNIVNTDTVAHTVTVQPTIVDWEGNRVPLGPSLGSFSVPAGGVKTATYNVDTSRRGTFRLGFDLTSENQTWHQLGEVQYAVIKNLQGVGNADTSMFAMNMHMEREPAAHLARETQVLSQCGVKWIRAWWGWGMCEKTQGTFDFTEFDRQFNVINGAQMNAMCCLLRYYPQYEQSWAGSLSTIQQPPLPSMMGEWGTFCGKTAQHFAGQVKAYEIWNEPTTDNNGAITAAIYTQILNAAANGNTTAVPPTPGIRLGDPSAQIVAFAGVANSFISSVLAAGTAPVIDVASEHSYGQMTTPEASYPATLTAIKNTMSAGGAGGRPIWDSEQGLVGDDDGYTLPSNSEVDVAQLYTRDVVSANSQGSQKYFLFCADVTPTYGMSVFFGNYVPRPRLAALNACASFIDGMPYQKSYTPTGTNTYAHLFKGTSAATCVVWNTCSGMTLTLAIAPGKIQAYDTMGNSLPVGSTNGGAASTVKIAVERPAFIQCAVGDYNTLDTALTGMQVTGLSPVSVVATPVVGGVQVTLTGVSQAAVDGIVSLIPAATPTPAGWPAAQHFQSLALGKSVSFRFALPSKAAVKSVQVVAGNLRLATFTFPYSGR